MQAAFLALMAALAPVGHAAEQSEPCNWQPAWASSQMIAEGDNRLPDEAVRDATLRQIVRVGIAGRALRIRFSNAFGTTPLTIRAASVGRPVRNDGPDILNGTLRQITFDGRPNVQIPAGADWLSDPIDISIAAKSDIAITMHVAGEPGRQTSHPGSRASSWWTTGDATREVSLEQARRTDHWFMLSGVEVRACPAKDVIIVLGDSITDGRGSTTNGNDRWTDFLVTRLNADPKTRGMSVLNQGIGGNRVLADGLGPSAIARLDRDVLAIPGVRHLIVFEGVNDLGTLTIDRQATAAEHRDLVQHLTNAYGQIVSRARARGIRVYGATITPYGGNDYYHPDAANEADRQSVNAWIRAPGNFDGVIDMDAALADASNPSRLDPRYDSGDHLHPSPTGFARMADAVPLNILRQPVNERAALSNPLPFSKTATKRAPRSGSGAVR